VLHDCLIPGSRANIDHIAVGPTGIFTIETKNYAGTVRVRRSFFVGQVVVTNNGADSTASWTKHCANETSSSKRSELPCLNARST
jgi:hypothetical protein